MKLCEKFCLKAIQDLISCNGFGYFIKTSSEKKKKKEETTEEKNIIIICSLKKIHTGYKSPIKSLLRFTRLTRFLYFLFGFSSFASFIFCFVLTFFRGATAMHNFQCDFAAIIIMLMIFLHLFYIYSHSHSAAFNLLHFNLCCVCFNFFALTAQKYLFNVSHSIDIYAMWFSNMKEILGQLVKDDFWFKTI